MNRQNQEYFKTRRKHEDNVSPKAWLLIIPILAILLGVMAWATKKSSQISMDKSAEEMQNIGARIMQSNKTEGETLVELENLDLSVLLHEDLKFDYSTHGNMLTAISQDTSELAYVIGEVPLNMQKPNMKQLWINGIKQNDQYLTIKDSLDQTIIETRQNGKQYMGILKFKEIGTKRLVFQSVCLKKSFGNLQPQMNKVFNSIKKN